MERGTTRAIWTGSLSFGLVSVPVRLHSATAPKDVRFHQLDRSTGQRVRQQRVVSGPWPAAGSAASESIEPVEPPGVDPRTSEPTDAAPAGQAVTHREVPEQDVVRGFELPDSRFVTITEEEIRDLRPEQSHTIVIEEFVQLGEIDPIYFEKSYYVTPQRGAEKTYVLLMRAMQRAERVAVARFVLRTKEHLAAIRPMDGALVLETLFFADEVIPVPDLAPGVAQMEASKRELDVAVQLIELLAASWQPARHRDSYRERLLELIRGKAEAEQIRVPEPAPAARQVSDLLQALRASVEAAKRAEPATPKRRQRRPPA